MRVSHDERAASIRGSGTVLIFATLHGLAAMANNRMIDPLDDRLISDAVDSMLTGLAPAPVLPDGAFE
jgi:hypothetical protein